MSFDDTFEKQLVEAYDKSARHFSQLFNATIIFAFAFLAFILVPLVALQREDATIDQALVQAKIDIGKAEAEQKISHRNKARPRHSSAICRHCGRNCLASGWDWKSRMQRCSRRSRPCELALDK